jgi:hypothetical protein
VCFDVEVNADTRPSMDLRTILPGGNASAEYRLADCSVTVLPQSHRGNQTAHTAIEEGIVKKTFVIFCEDDELTASVASAAVPDSKLCIQRFSNVVESDFNVAGRVKRSSDLAYGVVTNGELRRRHRQPFKIQDFLRLSHRLSHFFCFLMLTFPTAQYFSLRKKRRGQDSESLTDGEVESKRQGEETAGSGVRKWTHHPARAATIKQSSHFGEGVSGGEGRKRDNSCHASVVSWLSGGGSSAEV